MKANALRGPLIKSAIVLLIISMLAFFTSTSPGGGLWGSMGTLVITILRTVQWIIGMIIALSVSLAVMIGIFLGAVALVNPASSSRMFEGLRQTLSSWFAPVLSLLNSDKDAGSVDRLESFVQGVKKELAADVQQVQANLGKSLAEVEGKISRFSSRVGNLEETAANLAQTEQVDALAEEVKGAGESLTEIKSVADSLKGRMDQAEKQVKEVAGEAILGDLPSRIEALEQKVIPESVDTKPLEKDITALKNELATVQKQVAEALEKAAQAVSKTEKLADTPVQKVQQKKPVPKAAPKKEEAPATQSSPEHRIFSYFDNDADKTKVIEVVASTLKKDMSYKQVMDLVAKNLGGKKGEIITSHPSLSKDYIRLCRRNS